MNLLPNNSLIRKFSKNRVAVVSLGFLIFIALLAIFAPFVTRFSYQEQHLLQRLEGPTLLHWMGTDTLGRDLYSRIIYGARMSLSVGICTALVTLLVGTLVGSVAG